MRNVIFFASAIVLFVACTNRKPTMTSSSFNETYANFGLVDGKDTLRYNFLVKNTGESELIIDTVTASCGCINYTWMKEPIARGHYGYISVAFKPNPDEFGAISKTVMVSSNTRQVFAALKILYKVKSN